MGRYGRVDLAQLVRFLVVELTHPGSNLMTCVLYLRLIILLVGVDVPVNRDTLLVTDFVNLNIKDSSIF
jgi:hypothetical protein